MSAITRDMLSDGPSVREQREEMERNLAARRAQAPYTIMDVDYAAGDLLARQRGRCARSGHRHHDVVYGETAYRLCGADRVTLPLRCTWHPCCLVPGHAGEHMRSTRAGLVVVPITEVGIQ